MGRARDGLFLSVWCWAAATGAAADLQHAIDALLEASPVARASVGIQVVDLKTGSALYSRNADRLYLPASNMKLFTAALALERLGPDYRMTTRLVRAPSGDLILVGGGDPSLSGRAYPYQKDAPPANPLRAIEDLADQAVAAGILRVDGDIVGDDQLYPWAPYPPSWTEDDMIGEDGAPVSALTVNDNAIALSIHPAARAGELAAISFRTRDRVLRRRQSGAHRGRREGSPHPADAHAGIAADSGVGQHSVGRSNGPRNRGGGRSGVVRGVRLVRRSGCAAAWRSAGVRWPGIGALSQDPWPVEGDVIATRTSPPMVEMLQVIEKVSQNLHAELMLREVARVTRGAGTRESGLQELAAWLASIGIRSEEWRAEDGSGLSRNDQVSPRAVTRLLSYMAASKNGAAWLSLLPVGGEDGTLAHRLCCVNDTSAARQVRAKTGTLDAGDRAFRLRRQQDSRTAGLFDPGQQLFRAPSRSARLG